MRERDLAIKRALDKAKLGVKPSVIELAEMFQADRKSMDKLNSDTAASYALLKGEVSEADEAFHNLSQDPSKEHKEELAFELADIALFVFALIRSLGLDPDMVIREKIGRNVLKYEARHFQNGTPPQESIATSKALWKAGDGDTHYFKEVR